MLQSPPLPLRCCWCWPLHCRCCCCNCNRATYLLKALNYWQSHATATAATKQSRLTGQGRQADTWTTCHMDTWNLPHADGLYLAWPGLYPAWPGHINEQMSISQQSFCNFCVFFLVNNFCCPTQQQLRQQLLLLADDARARNNNNNDCTYVMC